jgi:hypothetical protein
VAGVTLQWVKVVLHGGTGCIDVTGVGNVSPMLWPPNNSRGCRFEAGQVKKKESGGGRGVCMLRTNSNQSSTSF